MGTVTGDQFDAGVLNEYELYNIDLIVQVEAEQEYNQPEYDQSGYDYVEYPDYAGVFIDGTGEEYNRLEIYQNGDTISFDWYCGDEYQLSKNDLPINEEGSVNIGGGGFWMADGTLKYNPGSGGSHMTRTFWRVG